MIEKLEEKLMVLGLGALATVPAAYKAISHAARGEAYPAILLGVFSVATAVLTGREYLTRRENPKNSYEQNAIKIRL
tara:strand:+ start:955 stop:1185 length:231 start_codon:yes stop_codon:yes gene_type:complete